MNFKSKKLLYVSGVFLLNFGGGKNADKLCAKGRIGKQLVCLQQKLNKVGSDNCNKAITPIFANQITPAGLVITQSGVYCLAEDVVFAPKADCIAGITIDADNVVLNLNQHELSSPLVGNLHVHNVGIRVAPNHKDVTIQNGTVRNIGAVGIRVEGGCKVLNLLDLTVKYCGGRGELPLANPNASKNTFVSGGISINGAISTPTYCVYPTVYSNKDRVSNVLVRNVQCYENTGDQRSANLADTLVAGLSCAVLRNLTIDKCISNDNSHPGTRKAGNAGTGRGIGLSDIANLVITECITNGNNGALASAGTSVTSTNGGDISNCYADGNFSGPGPDNSPTSAAAGFESSDSGAVVWRNCIAKNTFTIAKVNIATPVVNGAHACGFVTQRSNNVLVENCSALNTHGGRSAVGFKHLLRDVGHGNNVVFKHCKSIGTNNLFTKNDPQFNGENPTFGFQTQGNLSTGDRVFGTVFESCCAEGTRNNFIQGNPTNTVAGFDLLLVDSCVVVDSRSIANITEGPNNLVLSSGHGINLRGTTLPNGVTVNSLNCKVDNNETAFNTNGITVTNVTNCTVVKNEVTSNKRGIAIAGSTKCLVSQNEVSSNGDFGILLQAVKDCKVDKNEVAFSSVGISLQGVQECTAIKNEVSSNLNAGIIVASSTHCAVAQNEVSSNGIYGIIIEKSKNCKVDQNEVVFNNLTQSPDGAGIKVMPIESTNNILVSRNLAFNNSINNYVNVPGSNVIIAATESAFPRFSDPAAAMGPLTNFDIQ